MSIPFGYTRTWSTKDKYDIDPANHRAEKRLVRLGLIGLGGIAQGKHLPALNRLVTTGDNLKVVAAAEPQESLGRQVEALYGAKWYADYREMLDRERLDVVEVLTGAGGERANILREAIERGVHVFCEKPLLFDGVDDLPRTLAVAREILKRADEKGVLFGFGFSKRFSPPYQVAKGLVAEGAIGRPSLFIGKMCQGWSKPFLLENQACHLIDMTRNLMGEVAGVFATGVNRYNELQYPLDNVAIAVDFTSGAVGTLCFNSSVSSLKPWERAEVYGEGKWLSVEDSLEVHLHDSDDGPSKCWRPVMPTTLFFDEEFGGFVGELRHFLTAVRGEEKLSVSGWDGYEALRIAEAVHRSARTHAYVELSRGGREHEA